MLVKKKKNRRTTSSSSFTLEGKTHLKRDDKIGEQVVCGVAEGGGLGGDLNKQRKKIGSNTEREMERANETNSKSIGSTSFPFALPARHAVENRPFHKMVKVL